MNKVRPIWTEAKVDELARILSAQPKRPTYVALGKHFGCTKNAIAGIIYRSNLSKVAKITVTPLLPPPVEFPGRHCCVWPKGHMPELTFCGDPTIWAPEGHVYCAKHRRIAHTRLDEPAPAMTAPLTYRPR